MAKSAGSKAGNSKIRFIMLEADLSEGDLSQVTQAIQNALRPSPASVRVIQALPKGSGPEEAEDVEIGDIADVDESENGSVRKTRVARPRVIKAPKVLDGIDWGTDPSLASYVEDFDLKTDFERYLVIALWFRDHRDIPAITASHAYTAYRHLGWSTSIPDFVKPFRNMRDNQLFTGGAKEGFAINQLGEGKIKKKKRG